MGACQNEFHNVPDITDEEVDEVSKIQKAETVLRARENEVIRSGAIRQQHKNVRPNSKQIEFGMIDRDRIKSQYLSRVSIKDRESMDGRFSINNETSPVNNILENNRQLDRQELHQTVRPYKDVDEGQIDIKDEDEEQSRIEERNRKELKNYDFYYSLAMPEYVYPPFPEKQRKDFEDLVLGEQEERHGVKYIGEWKDGKIHGNGVLQSNTVKYIGQFKKGIKWFHGREIEQDEVYEGEFVNGRRKGQGVRFTEESVEEGQFDIYLEKGKIMFSNGDSYEGDLKNNKFHGSGRFVEKGKGIVYQGQFKKGKLSKGRIQYQDGRWYKGELQDGLKNGKGYFYWDKDNSYEGDYKNGKKHGQGILRRNGVTYKGKFQNGEIKEIKKPLDGSHQEHSVSESNGDQLEANWKLVLDN